MKLLVKFSLIFALVFGAGLAVAGYVSYQFLQKNAREQVLAQAQLMMQAMMASRKYTTEQLKPLLVKTQEHAKSFLPQTVPAFAATENFNYLRTKYPDYEYKEATLNPTNPRDRAVDWEADVIRQFRNHPDIKQWDGEREAATGRSLFLARPIVADPPCLSCHDQASGAPAAMVSKYGPSNGFGWKSGEIIGAQIVSVPMALPLRMADKAFQLLMTYVGLIFLVSLVVLNIVLLVTITRPVSKLSDMADRISQGQLDIEELPVTGKDEISHLAGSFNRMQRSLVRAMKMLEGDA